MSTSPINHSVSSEQVRLLAEQLRACAGDTRGDFVFATISSQGAAPQHHAVANGPNAAEEIVALIASIGAEPHQNVYFAGSLFRSGSVTRYRGRTKENVIGVLCAVTDFDAKNNPETRHERLPTAPGSELETSPGNFHCHYWFDRPYPGEQIEPALYALARVAGADDCKSTEHLWRVPGTWNWPDSKKLAAGRKLEPYLSSWFATPDDWNTITVGAFEAAILNGNSDPFTKSTARGVSKTDFDWSHRLRPQEPVSGEKIRDALNQEGNRSALAFGLIGYLQRHGYSAEEVVVVLIDNSSLPVMGHYGDPVDEDRVRKDVQRAYGKLEREHVDRKRRMEASVIATAGDTTEPPPMREIVIRGGDGPDIVDQAEQALIEQRIGMFQHGARLVYPASHPVQVRHGKPVHDLVLVQVTPPRMREQLTRGASFLRWDARTKQNKRIDCPREVAETLLARVGQWNLRPLTGMVNAPTLRENGSVLDQPGYDQQTGLIYDPQGVVFPRMPDRPTLDDARISLGALKTLIRKFPFATDGARAVALAGMLTGCIRRTLPTAPMFAIDSPAPGTGKGLLADTITTIGIGRPASSITPGDNEGELEKRIGSLLLQGELVICIDNLDKPLESDALCSILTQETQAIRILGQSRAPKLPTNCLFLVTGNGITVSVDMSRRCLFCLIDTGIERPSERSFDFSPLDMVRQDRGRYVTAALTILRAYRVAGRPAQGGKPMGSYEEWCRTVRDALMWLGEADAVLMQQTTVDDPERERFAAVIEGWNTVIGTQDGVTLREAVAMAEAAAAANPPQAGFLDALSTVAPARERGGGISIAGLGYWLRDKKRRVIRGMRLLHDGESKAGVRWRLEQAQSGAPA